MPNPHLPPELEHDIFFLAYNNHRKDVKNLILVARRVFDWLMAHELFLVELSPRLDQCYPIKFNKNAYRRSGHFVRHLWLGSVEFGRYLGFFPKVVDLVFHDYSPRYLPSLLRLRALKRLSIHSWPELMPVFAKLTHLHMPHAFIPDFPQSGLHLPKLTHLCVSLTAPPAIVKLFLSKKPCPKLWVVIIREYADSVEAMLKKDVTAPPVDDERAVMISCQARRDWEKGARGEVDMWKLAEGIIEKRKRRLGLE